MSLLPEVDANMAVAQRSYVPIGEVTTLLTNSSLTAGNARILIYSYHDHGILNESLIPPVTELARGREISAVSQTTHDVDLTIKFPTLDLQFQIIYDPGIDDCLFVNQSSIGVRLFKLGSSYAPIVVGKTERRSIRPGFWRVAAHPELDIHDIFDFFLNERLFNVSIFEPNISPAKRTADGLQIEPECTASSREIIHKGAVPLLDLKDRETAAIETQYDDGSGTYQLQRFVQLGPLGLVKVLGYTGVSALDLPDIVGRWKAEKQLLGNIKHRNIVSLEAFDGRIFALYLEVLPLSLDRGYHSPFSSSDAHKILVDMTSALAYLSSMRIVHNDIKPGNIAYSSERGAVLFDFGCACYIDEESNGGTACYLPPEYMENKGRGLPGDIWAMGVTMLYVLQKIGFPETLTKNWAFSNPHELIRVCEEENGARPQLKEWMEYLDNRRADLDQNAGVQKAVYQMLDGNRKSRAVAYSIIHST
ncbi:uncharacterized protein Triagg1_2291 [Trichoderma aggressivum f. europaeum]|uniref:Protein kinase domain-containing protein n=1 Tax=Trichoderma aggressivum f. europaeum TaxID=173218 RepID=A0AAE1IHN2_9HYPO|nr:hypothetical protein Triagg1_2291 [Trichoderma aggressivum f. europaeum]